jgi:hypothetical protein
MVYLMLVNLVPNKFDHPDDVSIEPADLTDMCLSKLENFQIYSAYSGLDKIR